jgi:predicted dienelactone hydrolase
MRRLLYSLLLTAALTLASAASAYAQSTARVGLTTRVFHPTATRNWRGAEHKELHCTIWYPAIDTAIETPQSMGPPDAPLFLAGSATPHADFAPSLRKLPMIVLSHGTGGSALQLAWLGTQLARAGFIAVAVDHPGNNANEPYTAEGFALWWERATDLSEVIDAMLADPELSGHIDLNRIGAAGFSIGGYTVMELAGATTDVSIVYDQCRQHPETAVCHVPEMKDIGTPDQMLQAVRKTSRESLARSADSFRDQRAKAVFAIAPFGEALTQDSLHAIRIPVAIVAGNADPILSPRDNADWIRSNIRGAQETLLPGGVAHYTFLDTCTAAGKSTLGVYCADAPGVDRNAVHAQVAAIAVTFFNRALKVGKDK